MKIAVIGMQHETNTFSNKTTEYDDFYMPDNWPALSEGSEILNNLADKNIPASGFINKAKNIGHTIIPILWCSAPPSGKVRQKAFNKILNRILELLKQHNFDAIYCDLHGAMVTEDTDDADGHILQTLRQCYGENITIAASVDLHANITPLMLNCADLIIAYQTYPHLDMFNTGCKVAEQIKHATSMQLNYTHLDFLITMTAQCTDATPNKNIFKYLRNLEKKYSLSASFCCGFPLADTYYTGPCIFAYGHENTKIMLNQLAAYISECKKNFFTPIYTIKQAIKQIKTASNPYILADTQDNPGCGGAGNTTEILQELLQQNVPDTIIAMFFAPDIAKQALLAGVGAKIKFALGPNKLKLDAEVLKLSTGKFICRGPFYAGCAMQLGNCALLKIKNIEIIVSSKNVQAADRAMLTQLDVKLNTKKIIVLKSSVHFRADFASIAQDILIIKATGLNNCDLSELNYRKLRSGVTISNATTTPA